MPSCDAESARFVNEAITKIVGMQQHDGSFSYWPGGRGDVQVPPLAPRCEEPPVGEDRLDRFPLAWTEGGVPQPRQGGVHALARRRAHPRAQRRVINQSIDRARECI